MKEAAMDSLNSIHTCYIYFKNKTFVKKTCPMRVIRAD